MKKIWLVLCLQIILPAWASVSIDPLLNKITLRLSEEDWVTTKTALVTVNINAAVTDQGIETLQTGILQKLNQLANPAEWHIVSFDRQQDKSGLENVQINAQARLQQTNLGNLRDKAKSLSKPGETYTIANVQFIPSEAELKAANLALRTKLYQQVKNEMDLLNQTYPDQKYYVHSIDFISAPIEPMLESAYMAKSANLVSMPAALSVGNKQKLQATVQIASLQTQLLQQLIKS